MVEATNDDNLPCGVSVNHTYVNPTKAKQVSVILLNTNSYNVWIRQPLYATTIWDVELKDWDYEPIITKSEEADTFEVKLQPVPPEDLREEILSNVTEVNQETNDTSGKNASTEKDEKPSFCARPNTKNPDFDFKKELERLPFELNIGDAPLPREQQVHLIDVIYDHTEVFSLFNGDLGFCDVFKHSIPTTTDKPVYLPHRQIPVQLQSEVRKCLDNWLKQGIIRPSKSPYASQVVIVRKKTGEICLCVDFRKLNTISIRDSFPLPHVEEALQAIQAAVWFSSFDLAQGYLQMAMEEEEEDKIQDNNKDQIYIITGQHDHRNAYFVKPLGSKCQPKQVNRREMFDLGITEDQELECRKQEEENEEEGKNCELPLYNPAVSRKKDFIKRPYNLRPRNWKTVNSQAVLVSTHL